mgnify:CR=1 FL=1
MRVLIFIILILFNFKSFADLKDSEKWSKEFKKTNIKLCSQAIQYGKPLETLRFKKSVTYIYKGHLYYTNIDYLGNKFILKDCQRVKLP